VLEWVIDHGCNLDLGSCVSNNAAEGGHLDVLKWLRSLRYEGPTDEDTYPWGEVACACAACFGHLQVLQWLRVHGCEWDEETCVLAARQGHLEVLQWARENHCPWDQDEMCRYAGIGGNLEVLMWVIEQGCPAAGEPYSLYHFT